MYCSNCGTPITSNNSYCNRCGNSLRERSEVPQTGALTALVTAITVIGIGGLGLMLGGSLALRKGGDMPTDFIAVFMLFAFIIISMTEFMLIRNLSRLIGSTQTKPQMRPAQQPPLELRAPSVQSFEPIGSVTENTTRTLEYATREKLTN